MSHPMGDDYARKLAAIASRRDRWLIPKDSWDERDWRQHRLESRQIRQEQPRLDLLPVVQPLHAFSGFDLYAKLRKGNARSRAIDRLLEKHLGRR